MNILFVTSAAPANSPFFTDEKRPPLGVGSLIALARQEGHTVHFLDNYLNPSGFPSGGYLEKHHIDVVGIHVNTICFRDSLRMFKELELLRRASRWEGKILAGGPHASVAPETIPGYVDHVVQGEGENVLLDILNGKQLPRIVRGQRLDNLDVLPFQPWDIFASLPYHWTCGWMDVDSVFTMNTSRGCPFNCAFCSVQSVWGSRYTYQTAERAIAEMEYLIRDYGAKGFYFREDHFTLNRKRTEEFCNQLLRKGIRTPWACETRVDCMSEDLIRLMSAAGCAAVYLGVESGSQRVLDLLNKGITVGQIENTVQWCKKYGIKTYCSLIVGVPGENFEDYLETRALMERLKPDSYAFNVFVGVPTSPLYEEIMRERSYEYVDDVGLAYMPGFDCKAWAFYNTDSRNLVDHNFRKRTEFDRRLLPLIRRQKRRATYQKIISVLPGPISNTLRWIRKVMPVRPTKSPESRS